MGKTLLFVGGGLETVHAIKLAQARGLRAIVSDMNREAPGMQIADDRLVVSTYDIEASVAAAALYDAQSRPIDGVISVGVDVPRTVAAIAAALGLRGVSEDAARLSADKLAMKERFQRDRIPIPWFAPVESAAELKKIVARGGAFVVKPVDSRGSRGVQRLLPGLDLSFAFERAKSHSPTGRVMIEAYLEGPQVSTESLVLGGRAHTPGFSDRNYEYLERYAPYFIENGGELPSRLPDESERAVHALIERAAESIGVRDGPLKGDVVVHRGVPHIIEAATRLSGGFFCTLEIPLSTGVDFVGTVIDWALGEAIDPARLAPRKHVPVVQRYAFLPPGRVRAIERVEEARGLSGVAELVICVKPGDIIREPTDTTVRAAMAIGMGATVAHADAAARAALRLLVIDVEPVAESARARA
jgi:biotin carboxylase